jgi:transcriptional regulator with XRE-family HTH domain
MGKPSYTERDVLMSEQPLTEDSNAQRRRLGIELRRRREGLSLTQGEAAARLEWSLSKLIRIEEGEHGTSLSDLKAILDLYGITDARQVESLRTAARLGRGRPWWNSYRDIVPPPFARYLGFEGLATRFRVFHPYVVPALLHTEDYVTALLNALSVEDALRLRVELRMERQRRVFAQPGVHFTFIMGQEALYRWIGGPSVQRRQLEHLIEVGQRENVTVKIVPFSAGAHPGLPGAFNLLSLGDDDEEVAYIESAEGDHLIRGDQEKIFRYGKFFESLTDLSVSAEALLRGQVDALSSAERTGPDGSR